MIRLVIMVMFLIGFASTGFAQEEVHEQHQETPAGPFIPGSPEDQQKLMAAMMEGRKELERLSKERDELIKNQAPQESIQLKMHEIRNVQTRMMELMKTMAPAGAPGQPRSAPGDITQLSPEKRAELQSLMNERKKMVSGGATHEDIKELNQKIHQLVYGSVAPTGPVHVAPMPVVIPPAPQSGDETKFQNE